MPPSSPNYSAMAEVAVHLVAPLRAVKHHESHAHVVWIDHKNGKSGRLRSASGAFSAIPVSPADNTDPTDRATTPGELLAAAHTTSFISTLAELLTRGGTPARELEVHATCEIEADERGSKITAAHLRVRGRDTHLDAATLSKVCEQALATCPISRALSPGIAITLNARVAGADQSPSRARVRTPVPSSTAKERVQASSSHTASRAEPLRCAELGIASIEPPARRSSRNAFGRSVSPTQGSAGLALVARQAELKIIIQSREVKP